MELLGTDGNGFALISVVRKALRKAEVSQEEKVNSLMRPPVGIIATYCEHA